MCLGQAPTRKLNLRIKYLKIEIDLQRRIISQLKQLHESSRNLKPYKCQHSKCKIDHEKYNYVSHDAQAKPNVPKKSVTECTNRKKMRLLSN